jgi:hypothetical protein
MNYKFFLIILAVLSLFILSVPTYAFEDTFDKQLQPGQAFSNQWATSVGNGWRIDVTSSPLTTYNKVLRIENYFSQAEQTSASTNTIISSSSNYWAMQVVQFSYSAIGVDNVKVNFYNAAGSSVGSYPIHSYLQTYSSGNAKSVLYEFTSDTINMFLKVNGTTINLGTISGTPYFFGLSAETGNRRLLLYVEMVTTNIGQIGIGTDSQQYKVTELNNPAMNISWLITTIPQTDFNNKQTKIKICKVSSLCLRETIVKNISNTTSSGYDNFNWQTLLGITNYGLYFSYLQNNNITIANDYFFFSPPGTINSVTAVDTSMVIGQIETITYSLDAPNFIEKQYAVNVYSLYGLVQSFPVVVASGTVNWDTSGNSNGLYFIVLSKTTSGIQTDIAYTTVTLVSTLLIRGTVYDAQNVTTISGASINISQGGSWFNTTSAADGSYNLSGLFVQLNTNINASKTGYTHNNFSFTPLAAQVYTINLYMINNSLSCSLGATTNTCIVGMTENYPYHQAIPSATVALSNGSYSTTTTSNATTGFYIFKNLADGNLSYTVNATKTNYQNSPDYNVTTINQTFQTQIVIMYEIFTLTIVAQDSTNANMILNFISTFNGTLYNTTIGTISIPNLIYGQYPTVVSSTGYLTSSQNILVDSTKTSTFILVPITPVSSSTVFKTVPHNVRFLVQDYTGNPYTGVQITVQGYNTTLGEWSWLSSLLGIDFGATPINNASMTGATGIDGSASFMMIDTIYYGVNFNAGSNFNISWNLYPKEDFYILLVPLALPNTGCVNNVTANLTESTVNSTHTALGLTYLDPSGSTTLINFFVQNNQSVYIYSVSNISNSSWSPSYSVNSSVPGTTYFWGYNATITGCNQLSQTQVITFRGSGRLIDLHIPDIYYQWISIFLIVFAAALFSIKKMKFGAVIVPIVAGMLWVFGWFTINPMLLAIALVLGVMVYLRQSEQKVVY